MSLFTVQKERSTRFKIGDRVYYNTIGGYHPKSELWIMTITGFTPKGMRARAKADIIINVTDNTIDLHPGPSKSFSSPNWRTSPPSHKKEFPWKTYEEIIEFIYGKLFPGIMIPKELNINLLDDTDRTVLADYFEEQGKSYEAQVLRETKI